MAATSKLRVSVITPARTVLEQDAASVIVPAFDGEWGILPGHAPFMALLGCGRLTVTDDDGGRRLIAIRGGFLQVSANVVTVLTAEAASTGEINSDKVTDELRELKAMTPKSADREAHEQKQAWAQARLKLVTTEPATRHN
jgi:F-type H+-transporting ATPase subunit epsilon